MTFNNSTLDCSAIADTLLAEPSALTGLIALIFLNVLIILGNGLVVAAVVATKKFRTLTYFLITSLACADLMIGIVVLPFSTSIHMYGQQWLFGRHWCQMWLAIDVWMCTASIFNLTAIGIDRYVAVVKPLNYPSIITPSRGRALIASAWIFSFLICFPPIVVQWPAIFAAASDTNECQCTPMDNTPGYIVYSAAGSFFAPMTIIVCLYIRIYGTVRRSAKSTLAGYVKMSGGGASANGSCQEALRVHQGRSVRVTKNGHRGSDPSAHKPTSPMPPKLLTRHSLLHIGTTSGTTTSRLLRRVNKECINAAAVALGDKMRQESFASVDADLLDNSCGTTGARDSLTDPNSPAGAAIYFRKCRANFINYQKKMRLEVRAAKTVAVVTGCFICCWLGFAIIYLLKAFPFCRSSTSCIPSVVFDICFWLGYANSALNPFIYAVFNKEFRRAFKNLLFCNHTLKRQGTKFIASPSSERTRASVIYNVSHKRFKV